MFIVIICFAPFLVKAQHWMSKFGHLGNYYQIKAATENYFSEDTSRIHNKSCGYKDFNRWMVFMESRVDEDGTLSTYNAAYNSSRNEILESDGNDRIFTEWQPLGPSINTHATKAWLGLITSIWVDESNFTTIYAGSNSGGLFVTYDGGEHWECLTDRYMVTGVESIEKNALEPNTIYIATGFDTWGRKYGVGVLKSTNNGLSWHETGLNSNSFQNETGLEDINFVVSKTAQNPQYPNTLFALVNFDMNRGAKIMRTNNGGNDWVSKVTLPQGDVTSVLMKLEMHPYDPDIMFASGRRVLKTIDSWETSIDLTNNFLGPNERLERAVTSIHPTNPDKILVLVNKVLVVNPNDVPGTRELYLSNDGGLSFTSISGGIPLDGDNYKMELEWSKTLENTFYIGGFYVYGYRFLQNNTVEMFNIPQTCHVDIREMKTYKDASGQGIIFQGNDGGITKGIETSTTVAWSDISRNGLNITQFYGIGIPSNNTDFIFGGTQDGNFERLNGGTWDVPQGGDAGEAIVYQTVNDYIIYRTPFMKKIIDQEVIVVKLSNSGSTVVKNVFLPDATRRNDAPLEKGSDSQTFYFGGTEVYRTTNDFTNFQKLSNFQSGEFAEYSHKLKTIRQAPSNSNIIYAARENPHWNCDMADCDRRRLFKTTNGGANYNWTDITPTSPEFSLHNVGIFDIAVHPTNPNLIYVALDRNVPGKRVFRYNDGVWTNISEGLPDVPVNCIKYNKRGFTLNELFAGTDLGVYYRNDVINRWIPFGTGLPLVSVSDIEISNSTKEIVASTFGRGIYKANLCFDPQEVNPTYVESTQTWGDKVLTNDVIINQGVVLTITGTVEMPPSKYIHVQKGGLLILDGGIITNACKDEQWGGVIVYGSSTQPQTLNYQGMIEIKNNGKIENALVGIHCKNAKDEDGGSIGTSLYSGGGIILANNANFYNNSIAVCFEKYALSSASRFRLCNFVTNDELFTDATFNCFIRMNEVNGVTFTGCSLKNEQSSVAIENRGKGIYSYNSFFMVDQYTSPTLPAQKTSFNDLWYGIYALGQKGGRTFSIQNTDFNYNERGIFAIGVDVINIRNSHFFMKFYNPFVTETKSGIYLDKCTGYIIEENDFHTTLSSPGLIDYGIYINSSGEANNTIYKNKFFDNKYGIAALDKNRNKDGSAGLMLKCNEFNNLKMDIVVMKTEPLSTGMGIASTQGTNEINCEYPAGNLFSNPSPPVTGYYSIHNDGGSIVYTHHNTSSNYPVRPSVVTERTVTRISTGFDYTESCCPPHPSGGGGVGRIDGVTLSYKTEAEATTQTLITLIDDGDTGEKVMDVNSAAPAEALLMRNNLLQTSPYVSDTVIKTAINREELLNNAMLRDIMVANPHSAKSENLMQELDMRLEPMPENMKDEILEGVFVLSAKELMEAKRDMNMQFYNYGFNRLLSASFTDSIPVSIDTLMTLLAADGSAESLMRQAWLYLENGDTTSALNKWNTIGNEIPLTELELAELSQQQTFMQWLVENQPIDTLDMEPLNNFLLYSSPVVTATARGILVFNNLLEYNEPYLEPDLTKSTEVRLPRVKPVNLEDTYLKLYPNPANDFITIEYNTGNVDGTNYIEIIDETGKKVDTRMLNHNSGQLILEIQSFKPGNYITKLMAGNKIVGKSKFMISR